MNTPDIIGLTGLKRHGKNAVAKILIEEYGYVERSLAGPLKEMAGRVDPVVGCDEGAGLVYLSEAMREFGFDEDAVKLAYPEYRRFLQRLGTEGIREVDDRFWIDQFWESTLGARRVVVTDVRFPNEATSIKEESWPMFNTAELWQVDAGARVTATADLHSSEAHVGLMGEDLVIDNSGTLEGLREAVRRAMEER